METKGSFTAFCEKHQRVLVLVLILLGAALRLVLFGSHPRGLNPDEASIGYEAFSLLRYGIDRNGQSWPALFIAWGSGQNVLYAYLAIPFVALFGLSEFSIRLPAVILGILSLPLFYALARRLRGVRFALVALAILATSPWHIMATRWALESNILPFFLLAGLYCLVRALAQPWWYVGAGVAFGLSLYAYGTTFVLLPVYFVAVLVYLLRRHKLRWPQLGAGVAAMGLVGWPVALCTLNNALGRGGMRIGAITLPALTEARQVDAMSFTPAGILANLRDLFRVLILQTDGHAHNTLGTGMLYMIFGLALGLLGTVVCLRRLWKKTETDRGEGLVALLLLCGLACSIFIEVNVNRVNFLFLPFLYMQAVGLDFLIGLLPRLYLDRKKHLGEAVGGILAAGLLLVSCLWFSFQYFGGYRVSLGVAMNYGLGQAIQHAEALEPQEVFISEAVNMPYIYALFYTGTPTPDFIDTVAYRDPEAGFRHVATYGHFRFEYDIGEPLAGTVYVVDVGQAEEAGLMVLAEYGSFAVAVAE